MGGGEVDISLLTLREEKRRRRKVFAVAWRRGSSSEESFFLLLIASGREGEGRRSLGTGRRKKKEKA